MFQMEYLPISSVRRKNILVVEVGVELMKEKDLGQPIDPTVKK